MKKKNYGGVHQNSQLQLARIKTGLTQEQASECFGCAPRSLQRYESGERKPPVDVLWRMTKCYECEFAELFPEESIAPLYEEEN